MAKKKLNPIQLLHHEAQIKFIFQNLKRGLFSKECEEVAVALGMKPELVRLKTALMEFKDKLIIELHIERDESALETAHRLDGMLAEFFYQSTPKLKYKLIANFHRYARHALFSQRTKTIASAVLISILCFAGFLALMITTQGMAVLGVGAAIGLSFLFAGLGGGSGGFVAYQLSKNKHEDRGEAIYQTLKELNQHTSLPLFISKIDSIVSQKERDFLNELEQGHEESKNTKLTPGFRQQVNEKFSQWNPLRKPEESKEPIIIEKNQNETPVHPITELAAKESSPPEKTIPKAGTVQTIMRTLNDWVNPSNVRTIRPAYPDPEANPLPSETKQASPPKDNSLENRDKAQVIDLAEKSEPTEKSIQSCLDQLPPSFKVGYDSNKVGYGSKRIR